MKTTLWVISMVLCLISEAQVLDWAPVGARWYYETSSGYGVPSFVVYSVEKDTLVDNIWCRKIIIDTNKTPYANTMLQLENGIAYNGTNSYFSSPIPMGLTFRRNDSIFFYHWSCQKFVPVAYTMSDTGVVWKVKKVRIFSTEPVCPYDMVGKVIQIDTLYFGFMKMKRFKFDNFLPFIENIGWTGRGLLPVWTTNVVDGIYLETLRCYYHPTYGWFHYDTSVPCDYVSVKEESDFGVKRVYIKDQCLYINSAIDKFPLRIKIQNSLGQILIEQTIFAPTPLFIDLTASQVIFIQIEQRNHEIIRTKLLYEKY